MDKNNYYYEAFISYRHGDLDQFTAEKLHKMLETFRVPKIASEKVKKQEKKTIQRVFRDKDELPISSNLSENILQALRQSEFLIVICTPRTLESVWVRKEIETFISFHDREHVLAVLVRGEPEESFPEELRWENKEIILPDGTAKIERMEVEPLAADVRGSNEREIAKKLKQELLRLAAPILGCSYDDLKQRHRERKLKRMLFGATATAAVFLIFGGISTTLALRIQKQAQFIEKQSEKIKEQYHDVMVRQSQTLADTSLRLLEEGDRIASILLAKEALPKDNKEEMEKPYTEQAEYALTQALRVYDNGSQIKPSQQIHLETEAVFFKLSPSQKRILTVDRAGKVSVWEPGSGSCIFEASSQLYIGSPKDKLYGFLDDTRIYMPLEDGLAIYNIESSEMTYKFSEVTDYTYALVNSQSLLAVEAGGIIWFLDTENGTVKIQYSPGEQWDFIEAMAWNEDSSLLAFSVKEETGNSQIIVYGVNENKAVNHISLQKNEVSHLLFNGNNKLLVSMNKTVESEKETGLESILGREVGAIGLYNLSSDMWEWRHLEENQSVSDFKIIDNEKAIMYSTYDSLGILLLSDGTKKVEEAFDSKLINYYPLEKQNGIGMLRNGTVFYMDGDSGDIYLYTDTFRTNSNNINQFEKGNGFYASLPYSSNKITIYENMAGSGMEIIEEFEDVIHSAVLSSDGKEGLISIYENEGMSICLLDMENRTKKQTIEVNGNIYSMFYTGKEEETITVISDDSILYFDRNGNLQKETQHQGVLRDVLNINEDGDKIIVREDNVIKRLKLPALTTELEYPLEDYDNLAAAGKKMEYGALASPKEKELITFDLESGKTIASIPIKASFVSEIFMNEEESLLFVSYQDYITEVYDVKSLKLMHTYTEFDSSVTGCITLDNMGCYLLYGLETGFLCKQDSLEVTGRIQGFKAADLQEKKLFISRNNMLAVIPYYDMMDLLKEADRQLDGRQLSEAQKELYHVE